MPEKCGGNVTEIYAGDGEILLHLIQPVGGTFFEPVYAKAIRDQFAEQVAHIPEGKRPTLIVFEDLNGEKVPEASTAESPAAEQTTDSLPA